MVRHFLSPVVTKAVAGLVVGCALSMLPARAGAQTPDGPAPPPAPASAPLGALGQGFGEQGQIVISGDASVHFDKFNGGAGSSSSDPPRTTSSCRRSRWARSSASASIATRYKGVLVGGGYSFNVTENISLWGRAGLSYNRISSPTAPRMTVTNSATGGA